MLFKATTRIRCLPSHSQGRSLWNSKGSSECLLLHLPIVVLKKFTCNIYTVEVSIRNYKLYFDVHCLKKCLHRKCLFEITNCACSTYSEHQRNLYTGSVMSKWQILHIFVMFIVNNTFTQLKYPLRIVVCIHYSKHRKIYSMEKAEELIKSICYPPLGQSSSVKSILYPWHLLLLGTIHICGHWTWTCSGILPINLSLSSGSCFASVHALYGYDWRGIHACEQFKKNFGGDLGERNSGF